MEELFNFLGEIAAREIMERTAVLESYCAEWITHDAALFEKEGVLTSAALVNNPHYDIISDPTISSLYK